MSLFASHFYVLLLECYNSYSKRRINASSTMKKNTRRNFEYIVQTQKFFSKNCMNFFSIFCIFRLFWVTLDTPKSLNSKNIVYQERKKKIDQNLSNGSLNPLHP